MWPTRNQKRNTTGWIKECEMETEETFLRCMYVWAFTHSIDVDKNWSSHHLTHSYCGFHSWVGDYLETSANDNKGSAEQDWLWEWESDSLVRSESQTYYRRKMTTLLQLRPKWGEASYRRPDQPRSTYSQALSVTLDARLELCSTHCFKDNLIFKNPFLFLSFKSPVWLSKNN